jgi:hypothetical protein
MQRTLIIIGFLVVAVGMAWPLLSRMSLGKLPGDIVVDRPGFKFFMPITTMLIVSALLSLLLWLLRK